MQVHKFQNTFRTLVLSAACSVALLGNALAFEANDGDAEGGDCPHIGVQTVPASVGASGPVIECDGAVTLSLGYKGATGTLTWTGTDCPTFVQIIPAHDKQIHKVGYKITSTVMVPRINLYYKCVYGWFDDDCVFDRQEDGAPPVQHSYEAPCEW